MHCWFKSLMDSVAHRKLHSNILYSYTLPPFTSSPPAINNICSTSFKNCISNYSLHWNTDVLLVQAYWNMLLAEYQHSNSIILIERPPPPFPPPPFPFPPSPLSPPPPFPPLPPFPPSPLSPPPPFPPLLFPSASAINNLCSTWFKNCTADYSLQIGTQMLWWLKA